MRFKITLKLKDTNENIIPINYQYPLSSAFYKIFQKGNPEYADFLHNEGYGKGYKLFTFSDLKGNLKFRGDRAEVVDPYINLIVCFHMPKASQTFIEGLFQSEEITIADKKSKSVFTVHSILAVSSPWQQETDDSSLAQVVARPLSMVVAGRKQRDGNYTFLLPDNPEYADNLLYNWMNKIETIYSSQTAKEAVLGLEIEYYENLYKTRLTTIKSGMPEETKIRGAYNFKIILTAEKRFINLLLDTGVGLYNAQGMGCLGIVHVAEDCEAA